jgi:DNA (cytosine-5)-methyltransferase 1
LLPGRDSLGARPQRRLLGFLLAILVRSKWCSSVRCNPPSSDHLNALSLFTGAGGLDIGLERAGFDIAGCVDFDDDCRATLRTNRPDWPQLTPGDVHAHRPADVLAALRLTRGELALIAGGPPCQPFSKSGQWRRGHTLRMDDPRARTLNAYLDLVEAALPEAMLLENVRGIAATRSRPNQRFEALDVVRSRLEQINRRSGTSYAATTLTLDAVEYGVPQRRERVFVVASREGHGLCKPAQTHADPASHDGERLALEFTTAWDAIGYLDDPDFDESLRPRGKWADLLPSIPEGGNYLHHTPRGAGEPLFGWRSRYWSFLLKLAKARPSWTLQAQAGPATGPFHWRSRRLMPEELLRLQCFPKGWVVTGHPTSVRRQLGNAVPPPLAEVLASAIATDWLGVPPRAHDPLVPTHRVDCPEPEASTAVPRQYRGLRGKHADHPGAGRGPAARSRLSGVH